MEWEMYEFKKTRDGLRYSFYSEGPRGRIGKVIEFQWMRGLGSGTFNLAFGDFNEDTGQLDDGSVSDNHDRLKVLHTVAAVVVDFLRDHPRSIILIKASTIARARLYQMMISSIWATIEQQYEILGKHGDFWIPFRKGLNYSEFIIYKKIK
jgi:hypothetical protein